MLSPRAIVRVCLSAKRLTRLVIDAFGPERLVWGGGTLDIVDVHVDRETVSEPALVKGGNLARLLSVVGSRRIDT